MIGSHQTVSPESVTSIGKALAPPGCNAWMCKKPGNGIPARLAPLGTQGDPLTFHTDFLRSRHYCKGVHYCINSLDSDNSHNRQHCTHPLCK